MGIPILIDTDMGADDALGISLALAADQLDVVGIVSVAGNVDFEQATRNIGRLLQALDPPKWPQAGRGNGQPDPNLIDARWLFGQDGLGDTDFPPARRLNIKPGIEVYRNLLDEYANELVVVTLGPLTNLARVWEEDAKRFAKIERLVIMGGAVWCPGNIEKTAEFNIYRDPDAASLVLNAGVPVTLVPLDVTRQVVLDEAHRARLSASDTRAGTFLDRVLALPLAAETELGPGRLLIHDAVAVGSLLWPELFMQTHIAVQVELDGKVPGATRPAVGTAAEKQADVLISVKATNFLENMIELLCHEKFVV